MQNYAQGVAVHSETHWRNHMERFPELADQEPRARWEAEFIAKHGGENNTEVFQEFLKSKLLSHDGDWFFFPLFNNHPFLGWFFLN